jgi:outer membrane lipoprotein SlyB
VRSKPRDCRNQAYAVVRGVREHPHEKAFVCSVTAVDVLSSGAYAGERPLDAGLGVMSGAVVFGPVGAIAGGVIGYTKGPAISHTLGLSGHHHRRQSPRKSP